MQIIKIHLKVPLTPTYLRTHIRRVLNKLTIGQYIGVHTKFMIDNNLFPTRSLGYKYYLNLENKEDKDKYLNYLTNLYRDKIINGYKYKRITGLYIQCNSITKEGYFKLNKFK